MKKIIEIFKKLYSEKFPSPGGKEVMGIDLIMLDADTMGLADTFIRKKGYLQANKIEILKRCKTELEIILPYLNDSERKYFMKLKELIEKILTELKK